MRSQTECRGNDRLGKEKKTEETEKKEREVGTGIVLFGGKE